MMVSCCYLNFIFRIVTCCVEPLAIQAPATSLLAEGGAHDLCTGRPLTKPGSLGWRRMNYSGHTLCHLSSPTRSSACGGGRKRVSTSTLYLMVLLGSFHYGSGREIWDVEAPPSRLWEQSMHRPPFSLRSLALVRSLPRCHHLVRLLLLR